MHIRAHERSNAVLVRYESREEQTAPVGKVISLPSAIWLILASE